MELQKQRENGAVGVSRGWGRGSKLEYSFFKRAPKTTVSLRLGAFVWEAYMVHWAALTVHQQRAQEKLRQAGSTSYFL